MNNSIAMLAITQAEPQFQRIAQAHNLVRWDVESQFAMQAMTKNTTLAECDPATIQDSLINVSAVGLTLNPADGYAYLVPEYNKARKTKECQLRISFKGLIKIATDTGSIKWVKAETVKANDTFEYNGPTSAPTHNMNPFSDRGNFIGVYCIAKTLEGDILCDVMPWSEVEQIKSCAKTPMVWNNFPGEMAKKAIIKRASKQWPKTQKSGALNAAVDVLNRHEGSDFDGIKKIEEAASYILENIEADDQLAVGEAWNELTQKEQSVLWTAITKGGYFKTAEKEYIRASSKAYAIANAEEAEIVG